MSDQLITLNRDAAHRQLLLSSGVFKPNQPLQPGTFFPTLHPENEPGPAVMQGHTDSGSNLAAGRLHFLGEFRCVNLRAKDASGPGPTVPVLGRDPGAQPSAPLRSPWSHNTPKGSG